MMGFSSQKIKFCICIEIFIMDLLLLDPLLNVDDVIGSEHGAHDGLQAEGHAALLGAVVHQLTLLPSLVLSTKYFT